MQAMPIVRPAGARMNPQRIFNFMLYCIHDGANANSGRMMMACMRGRDHIANSRKERRYCFCKRTGICVWATHSFRSATGYASNVIETI